MPSSERNHSCSSNLKSDFDMSVSRTTMKCLFVSNACLTSRAQLWLRKKRRVPRKKSTIEVWSMYSSSLSTDSRSSTYQNTIRVSSGGSKWRIRQQGFKSQQRTSKKIRTPTSKLRNFDLITAT